MKKNRVIKKWRFDIFKRQVSRYNQPKNESVYSSNADPSSSHPDPLRAGRSNLNSGILTPPFFATVGRVISMN